MRIRKERSWIVGLIAVAVGVLTPGLVQAWPPCPDNWMAGYRYQHSGCTAGPIDAGAPADPTAEKMYRHHYQHYTKSTPNSDIDCHRKTDCEYEDVSETAFNCDWTLQKCVNYAYTNYKGMDNESCSGADWTLTADDAWGYYYRAKTTTADTPYDVPYGDDTNVVLYTNGRYLDTGYPDPFVIMGGYPIIDDPEDGYIGFKYHWQPSCCENQEHMEHLDVVTIRYTLTYEPQWTSNGVHDMSHEGDNCFTSQVNDPQRDGWPGDPGVHGWLYYLHFVPAMGEPDYSECGGSQSFEWAAGWPNRPQAGDETVSWYGLMSHGVSRKVLCAGYPHNGLVYQLCVSNYPDGWCAVRDLQ